MNQLLILLCQSIHALQKERGSLCLHLSTNDVISLTKLKHCIKASNKLIDDILSYNNSSNSVDEKLNPEQLKSYNKLENIFNGFITKANFRENIDDLKKFNINILEVTALYAHSIIIHLTYVLTELALFNDRGTLLK